MLREKGGNRLKQERKCEYKFIALHVLRNNFFSFLLCFKNISNKVLLRDIGCFQAYMNQQGCLTALMETFKGIKCITTSRNIGNITANFKDLLLTRVYIDPTQFTKVRFSNLNHSILEDFETKLPITKPIVTSSNITILKHKRHNGLSNETFCGKYLRNEKKTNVRNKLLLIYFFFISIDKKLVIYCDSTCDITYEQSLVSSTKTITKREDCSDVYGQTNCHKNMTYNVVITTLLFNEYVYKHSRRYTASVSDLYNTKITRITRMLKVFKVTKNRSTGRSGYDNENKNGRKFSFPTLVSEYKLYISLPITPASVNDLVDLVDLKFFNNSNTFIIKLKIRLKSRTDHCYMLPNCNAIT